VPVPPYDSNLPYAKDLAGYPLDQVLCVTFAYGYCYELQPKVWSFKTVN
jgi:hypothetical protein